jgi:hypothetical protein
MSTASVVETVQTPSDGRRTYGLTRAGFAVTLFFDLAAGYVAWQSVRPGESLLGPTALAALIMFLPAAGWFVVIKSNGGWRGHRTLAIGVAVLCIVPVLWSYYGVLPASVSLDATAAHWIQTSIRESSPSCRVVSSGSVGSLDAPYKVCVYRDGTNYMVQFVTMDLSRGYAYVKGASDLSWFPDQCARELLVPHWWSFYIPSPTAMGCPFGFSARGGG